MKNFDELKKKYQGAIKAREDRARQINELEETIKELEAKAKEAAIIDNIEDFKTLKQNAEFKSFQLEALKAKQQNETKITLPLEEVQEAWNIYETKRKKELEKVIKAFEEAKDNLYGYFSDIYDLQNEGIKTRNEAAIMAGIQPFNGGLAINGEPGYYEIRRVFPMAVFENKDDSAYFRDPTIEYLKDIGFLNDNKKEAALDVLAYKKPRKDYIM